jgi:hypothetical protein
MSHLGIHRQFNAYNYFNIYQINKRNNIIIPENILELEKLIIKKKDSLEFLELLHYIECYDSTTDQFYDYILEEITSYENPSDEKLLFKESDFCAVYLGAYYIETKEGNNRNWIYSNEIDIECVKLYNYIVILEEELKQKIINIGVNIALLKI